MTSAKPETESRVIGRLDAARSRVEEWAIRFEIPHAAIHFTVFVAFAVYLASVWPLWFDEFLTISISRLPSWAEIWKAMPADGQPPLQYLLTRISIHLFGLGSLAVRLPELLAFTVAGILIYRIVRRHSTPVEALFATDILLSSIGALSEAATARPYALLMAFTAFTFACWQSAASRHSKRLLPLCGVAIGIAGAILSHHFGIFHVGFFLIAGELTRLVRRRRLDWGMIAAGAAGLSALIVTLPLIHRSHDLLGVAILHSTNYWGRPKAIDLPSGYVFLTGLAPLFLLIPALALRPRKDQASLRSESPEPIPPHEWAAAATLALLLPILLLISELATGYFQIRYAIGAAVGLAILAGWALPRMSPNQSAIQSRFLLSSTLTLVAFAALLTHEQAQIPIWQGTRRTPAISPLLLNAPGDLPIVVAGAFDLPADWWYSPPYLRKRLVYLSDPAYAIKQPQFLAELSLVDDRKYLPFHIENYHRFLASHRRFLLVRSGKSRFNWIVNRLEHSGWRLSVIARSGNDVLYRVTANSGQTQ